MDRRDTVVALLALGVSARPLGYLVINRKTARALGLAISRELLQRADEVID